MHRSGASARPCTTAQGDAEMTLQGVISEVDSGAEAVTWRIGHARVRHDYSEWHNCGWHWWSARIQRRCGHQEREDRHDQWPDEGFRDKGAGRDWMHRRAWGH